MCSLSNVELDLFPSVINRAFELIDQGQMDLSWFKKNNNIIYIKIIKI